MTIDSSTDSHLTIPHPLTDSICPNQTCIRLNKARKNLYRELRSVINQERCSNAQLKSAVSRFGNWAEKPCTLFQIMGSVVWVVAIVAIPVLLKVYRNQLLLKGLQISAIAILGGSFVFDFATGAKSKISRRKITTEVVDTMLKDFEREMESSWTLMRKEVRQAVKSAMASQHV